MIIYTAKNLINDKIYVGKTHFSLDDRKRKHLNESRKNKSKYTVFQKAIRKYGFENFSWEIICKCKNIEELNRAEIFYIKKLKTHISQRGYNMTEGGEGGDTFTNHPNKKKILAKRKRSLAKWRLTEDYQKVRKFLSKNMTGRSSKWLVGRVLPKEHKQKISQGIQLALKDPEKRQKICRKGIPATRKLHRYKIIYPNKKEIEIVGLNKFCKDNNLSVSSMYRVSRGKRTHCKKYKCILLD